MPSGHILIQTIDGLAAAHLPVLLVHVVRAGTRVVAQPDADVLDFQRALFVDLECMISHAGPGSKYVNRPR